jgi:MFS transporter, SP family, xylose:H+ symportor
VLAALFVWRYVPETKGKSLEAIQDLWGKGARTAFSNEQEGKVSA